VSELNDPCAYVLADPATFKLSWPVKTRGRRRPVVRYFLATDPAEKPVAFVDAVLRAQSQHEPSALISPSFIHGSEPGDALLEATTKFARASARHDLAKESQLILGAGVTESIVGNAVAREDFTAEVIEWPNAPLYLRVQVRGPESYQQYANPAVLAGLRTLVTDLVRNHRDVLLPQCGLVGWMMMGFGAKATGTGISSTWQRFAPTPGERAGPSKIRWYFLPQFLGFVQARELDQLKDVTGFKACECPYCEEQDFSDGGEWDKNLAGQHYLWWCARLVRQVGGAADKAATVRSRIARARGFWRAAQEDGVALEARSIPRHLEAWSAAVAG